MSLEPVHFDFVDSPYGPSIAGRGSARSNPFPLVGLDQAQFDALAAWDVQLDEQRQEDPHGNEPPLEPIDDRPRPPDDPLDRGHAASDRDAHRGARDGDVNR